MTNKTTMPDPMVEVDKHIVSSELQYTYLAPCGGLEHGTELITTDQAEAYADSRVRGALEDVLDLFGDMPDKGSGLMWTVLTNQIRALIPPTK